MNPSRASSPAPDSTSGAPRMSTAPGPVVLCPDPPGGARSGRWRSGPVLECLAAGSTPGCGLPLAGDTRVGDAPITTRRHAVLPPAEMTPHDESWRRSDLPSSQEDDGRNEAASERLDRNLAELLQEMRVAGIGVQVLFGFFRFPSRFVSSS